jgi:hypothetical protein
MRDNTPLSCCVGCVHEDVCSYIDQIETILEELQVRYPTLPMDYSAIECEHCLQEAGNGADCEGCDSYDDEKGCICDGDCNMCAKNDGIQVSPEVLNDVPVMPVQLKALPTIQRDVVICPDTCDDCKACGDEPKDYVVAINRAAEHKYELTAIPPMRVLMNQATWDELSHQCSTMVPPFIQAFQVTAVNTSCGQLAVLADESLGFGEFIIL